jgi:hypothetical protein
MKTFDMRPDRISSAPPSKRFPFQFVRVEEAPNLGICAVLASSQEGGVLLIADVTPVDVDAYELSGEPEPFWIDAGFVYGVSWKDGK